MHVLYGKIMHDEGPSELIISRAARLLYDVTLGINNHDIIVAHDVEDVRRYASFDKGGLVYTVGRDPLVVRSVIAATNELIHERESARDAIGKEELWRNFNEVMASLRKLGIEVVITGSQRSRY